MPQRYLYTVCQTVDTLVDKQSCLKLYPLTDWQPVQVLQNWRYPLELPGACDESSGGIVYRLQFVQQLTNDSSNDAVTVVEPTPNKRLDKCFVASIVSDRLIDLSCQN